MKKKDEKETREVTEAKSVGAYAQLTGFHRAVPIILIALAVFVTVCFVTKEQTGSFGIAVSDTLTGLFSIGGYFIPVFFLIHAFFYPTDIQKKSLIARVLSTVVLLLIISAFVETVGTWNQHPSFDAKAAWDNGKRCVGGGTVGAAVAFGLVAVIGYIGFAILAVTVVAIYFTYFLAGEHNPIRDFFRKIAFNVFSFFARVEKKVKGDKEDKAKAKKVDKKIKAQIKKDDKDKGKRQREQKRVNTLNEREGELFEDEFFEVDNGLKELKINELGITESRSDVDIELNPTLQNKVRHDAPASEERTAPREEKRIMNDPVDFIKRTPQRSESEDGAARSYSRSLEESADSVFADGSFTIDFAKAEKIAAKQSTMGPAIQQNRETAEVASEKVFTEKQIDEARRRDFELRKAELKRQRELEEEERRRAEAFRPTTVEFDINSAYAPKAEPAYASYEPKAEPVYTSYEPKAEPIAEEPKYIPTRIEETPYSASYSAPEEP
ncbi:MAG: DNA translocase FtsK 4TM domain-containing protein, partial [Clostridia bacterium]|nr:DNA translocase FtsK 4TM domain-containing protein [Clostridia bacterium]